MPFEQQKIESNPSKILSDFLKYVLFLFVLKVLICFDATRNVKNTKSLTNFFFLKSHLEFSPKGLWSNLEQDLAMTKLFLSAENLSFVSKFNSLPYQIKPCSTPQHKLSKFSHLKLLGCVLSLPSIAL